MFCALSNRDTREVAKSKVRDAKQVLDLWKSSYFEIRAEINNSDPDHCWDFDLKKLFERTDYIASICQDLYSVLQVSGCMFEKYWSLTLNMSQWKGKPVLMELLRIYVVQVLDEFHNIFGPELKSVTGDPKGVDEVLCKVDNLVLPIEAISFNPFNVCKISSWKMTMQDFNTTVQVSSEHLDPENEFWTSKM